MSYQSSLFTLKNFLILYGFIALNKLYSEWLHNKMLSKYNSDKKLKREKPENLTRGREGVKAGGKPSSCLVSFLNIPSPFTHPLPPPDNRGEVLAPAKRPRVGGEDLDSERGILLSPAAGDQAFDDGGRRRWPPSELTSSVSCELGFGNSESEYSKSDCFACLFESVQLGFSWVGFARGERI